MRRDDPAADLELLMRLREKLLTAYERRRGFFTHWDMGCDEGAGVTRGAGCGHDFKTCFLNPADGQ